MNIVDELIQDLVDAYGHIRVCHPDDPARYLLSRSRRLEMAPP